MNKQIEEMAREMCHLCAECETCQDCDKKYPTDDGLCYFQGIAREIINHGYRKASDVARNIFEDVKQLIIQYRKGNISEYRLFIKIEELQQKYESEGAE